MSQSPSAATPSAQPSPPPQQIAMQLAAGYVISAAVQVFVKLSLPEALAAGPRTAADLAKEAGAHPDRLYRILRALGMAGVVQEQPDGRFALTPVGEVMRKDAPGSVRNMSEWMSNPMHFRVYAETLEAVKSGEPAALKVLGEDAFSWLSKNPEVSAEFNGAMVDFSNAVMPAVLEAYDFSPFKTIVDVAGGHGGVLAHILQRYPQMQGILFDLEHVLAGAPAHLKQMGVAERCRLASGSFFEAVPEGGDAYLMKHIIHDWDDEDSIKILTNCRQALAGKKQGRVILIEAVVAPGNEPHIAKLIDVEMMVMITGRERTDAEFRALFERAGMQVTRVVHTKSPLSVIEAEAK